MMAGTGEPRYGRIRTPEADLLSACAIEEHLDVWEIPSAAFIEATKITKARWDPKTMGPLPPD